ncbi:MAG: DNA mismatch repair endonuclease MutL, partial [Dehalococcoidia bacterium]|nr:DNA mismatch repair endonuclease MutL [Dehalococcoidia bacterium]
LALCFERHATSKIQRAEDLSGIRTLGFRGEALASIAEVSQLVLRSRPPGADSGWQIEVQGGAAGPVVPCGCPVGTTIEVRHLFYNTPVRRKFLRASQTEIGHCLEAFTRLALAYPQVHFTLRHNDRPVWDLPPVDHWRQRIAAFFGEEIHGALIPIEGADGELHLDGFVADPSQSRANNRLQYLLLNGRFIRDRALQHALQEAYRGLLLSGRYPIAFLRLTVPPDAVDVNVHPTKLEVRFADSGRLYALLLATLRRAFLSTDLTTRVRSLRTGGSGNPASAVEAAAAAQHRSQIVAWATGRPPTASEAVPALARAATPHASESTYILQSPQSASFDSGTQIPQICQFRHPVSSEGSRQPLPATQTDLELQFDPPAGGPLQLVPLDRPWPGGPVTPRQQEAARHAGRLARSGAEPAVLERSGEAEVAAPAVAEASPDAEDRACAPCLAASSTVRSAAAAAQPVPGCQIHNRYLVAQCEEGLVVIDQHALHERILYEQLRARVAAGRQEVQRLLVTLPVILPPAEAAALLQSREVLAEVGLELEPFGPDTVLVRGYPAMLGSIDPAELVRQAAELVRQGPRKLQRHDLIESLLEMMACKAAIKAGDPLTPEEVAALLSQRHLYRDTHHCPHGRPTALIFTCEELDRRFKRT